MKTKAIIRIVASVIFVTAGVACSNIANETAFSNQEAKIDSYVKQQVGMCDTLSVVKDGELTTFVLARRDGEEGPAKDTIEVTYGKYTTRLTLQRGKGDALLKRGSVTFYYAGFDFSKGNISNGGLFATNNESFASSANWDCVDTDPVTVKLSKTDMVDGLQKGLVGVREGEDCYILFSGKHGFGSRAVGTIPANAPLAFRVWVESVDN